MLVVRLVAEDGVGEEEGSNASLVWRVDELGWWPSPVAVLRWVDTAERRGDRGAESDSEAAVIAMKDVDRGMPHEQGCAEAIGLADRTRLEPGRMGSVKDLVAGASTGIARSGSPLRLAVRATQFLEVAAAARKWQSGPPWTGMREPSWTPKTPTSPVLPTSRRQGRPCNIGSRIGFTASSSRLIQPPLHLRQKARVLKAVPFALFSLRPIPAAGFAERCWKLIDTPGRAALRMLRPIHLAITCSSLLPGRPQKRHSRRLLPAACPVFPKADART